MGDGQANAATGEVATEGTTDSASEQGGEFSANEFGEAGTPRALREDVDSITGGLKPKKKS